MADAPDCTYDAPQCSPRCCPKPVICQKEPQEACKDCFRQYTGRNTIVCTRPTLYDTPYMVKQSCCKGWNRQTDGRVSRSFLRVQDGRWNHTLTNTKLYPIIGECRSGAVCRRNSLGCKLLPAENRPSFKQSGNIFKNTSYEMSKSELLAYMARNRAYLYR